MAAKLRPVLILFETDRDVLVAFISSRLPEKLSPTGVVISEDHPEFQRAGLKRPSVIRLDKVATITKDLVVGEIGEVGPAVRKTVNERLEELYRL